MGSVFLAEDVELRRRVAIKAPHDAGLDPLSNERMLREARVIARLEHPGIAPVHDLGTLPDGRPFYVMKLIRGQRLDELLSADAPRSERLRVFERVCETVAFAHANGVIHRDLKPQNIMVGAFGEVLVLDWGVAKLLPPPADDGAARAPDGAYDAACAEDDTRPAQAARDSAGAGPNKSGPGAPRFACDDADRTRTRQTERGAVIGTPAYMAPEQARGELSAVDQRSDVYALGAILYFLMTGQAPRDGGAFLAARREDEAPLAPPRARTPRMPRLLEAICLKALAARPADRYVSAQELRRDVARFLNGRAVSAYRESLVERVARVAWRYRAPLLLIAAYLIVRVLLIFFGNR
jgi:serine/threonine protein kinase